MPRIGYLLPHLSGQRISIKKEKAGFNFFVLKLCKKSGFCSEILLDFEEVK